ncbi:hypothetical protein [Occallatibacter savannae]|uniref:hypothetical protein n=1 Tax=Occallatibacter savannae TaxID=1002691 RepID=UPI000D68BBE8|nr:hypothetical protein [Occallatibacter savannae]
MAKQKSPHTQTQQDTHFAQTDVNSDELEQSTGNASEYENMEGAETGGKRSPKTMPESAHPHNTEDQQVAYEGTLASRTFDDDTKQGVTTAPSSKEAEGQRKVVGEREDAQAGVNHSSKIPER